MINGFKEFILRGNAVDLAVGVVIGAAFGAVVTAIVDYLVNPLIAAIFGKPDLSDLWDITLREGATIQVGMILNAFLQFFLVALAVYFVIVAPMNALAARRAALKDPVPEEISDEVSTLREIRDILSDARGTEPRHREDPAATD
ncbi:large conductance mechanosensitive channel protein MscL [Paraoerskovia marina]|uniref:Large-conductance mechanosensitive channel n=1 Tax=Paraoerskovia marina TaxID=545619 RepID=A0A1H1QDU4_9CELL|nr:large conductance mechanosensitive channel protein MscL [Paraoerskovia marina]SDS21473.1 large conductance mechanosensitive channel [Paraoerskovia marina]